MIAAILAAAAALCAPGDDTISLEAAGPADVQHAAPAWANAPDSSGEDSGKLGAPGLLLDRTQSAGSGGQPAFLTGDGPGASLELKDLPRAQHAEAKYKPRVRAMGASAERPSVADIRLEVERRLKDAASRQPQEVPAVPQPAGDIAD